MSLLREALTALKDALRTEESWGEDLPDGVDHKFLTSADYGFPTRKAGICGNVTAYLEREGITRWSEAAHGTHDQLYSLAIRFLGTNEPKYPIITAYPVGGWMEFENEVKDGTIWKNQRRLALLDFMLEHCE